MTLKRRLSIFTFSLVLMLITVGAAGVAVLWTIRPALAGNKAIILGAYGLDDALVGLTSLTSAAVVITAGFGLLIRWSILRRIRQFHIPPGAGTTSVNDRTGDELDVPAQYLNELSTAVSQLRAKQRSEDEVESARRFADNIVQSMSDVLIVTDPDLRIVSVNQAACALLEYSELELVGQQIEDVFKEESITLGTPVKQLLKHSSMRDNEMTYRTSRGRYVSALVSASTMRDNSGRPLAIITVGKDITARKQIETDLLEAKTQAESANRAKSAFVANMSHEIRTPMTAILGYADLLTRSEVSVEERDRCVQTICRNGRHLLSIINDILDVSKIEAGKMTVERISCSPSQIVSDIAGLMAGRATDKNLAFNATYTGAIPHSIQTDPTRLRQILMNLVGNAIKFTEKGQVKLLVSFMPAESSPARDGEINSGWLRFDVVDTGVGLDKQQIATLFRPFVQADSSTTRKFGGTGLGLTISRRLAKMLGGDLNVHSVCGEGSTFSLTIATGDLTGVNMIDKPTLAKAADRSESTGDAAQIVRLNGSVLLAEDGPDNRVLLTYYLREVGVKVTAVENGKLARDLALEAEKHGRPFDLVLMDMQMPEMDGYEATRQLRAAKYVRPIVALTAHAMGGDREKCLSAGCDDFAVKPIEWEKLLGVLRRYLQEVTQQPDAAAAPQAKPDRSPASARTPQLDALLAKPGTSRLVEKFLAKLQERVDAIQSAAEAQDAQQLKVLAHQLKGAAGGYGFPGISGAAGSIEQIDLTDETALTQALESLSALCDEARKNVPVNSEAIGAS